MAYKQPKSDAPQCQSYFGLINPEAECDELHGFEVTLDNRVVAPELGQPNNVGNTGNLPATYPA